MRIKNVYAETKKDSYTSIYILAIYVLYARHGHDIMRLLFLSQFMNSLSGF